MNLSPDTIWETLKNINYEDIIHLCRTNRQFAEICRTPQAQAFFKLLQRQYRGSPDYKEKQIDEFLDEVARYRVKLRSLLEKNQYNSWQRIGLNMIKQFKIRHSQIDRDILEEIIQKGSDLRYEMIEKPNPTINKFIQEVDRAFLTKNYYYLPELQKSLDEIKDTLRY